MPITNSSSPTPNHFGDLDGVRGLLAITVMLYHYGLNTFLNQIFGVTLPGWGSCVDFFFVLSGFVICKSITANPISIVNFTYKRFWRLFPIHIAILLLFFPFLFKNGLQPTQLFLNFSAISPLVLQGPVNGPAWSMSFEYFVPIMLVALFSVRMLSRSMVFVFSLIFFVLASWSSHQTLSPPETRYFGAFLDYARAISGLGLGFCAWKIFESGTVRGLPKWNGTLFILIISGFFAVVLMSVSIPFLGFLMPSIIVAAMFVGANVRTFFSSKLFQWAGRLSFGVYMVHSPVLVAFVGYFGEAAMKGNVALKCCAIFVSFALAFVLHIFIENWGMKIGRSWMLSNHTGIKATGNS